MQMSLVNLGFGNFVSGSKIVAVVSVDSAPIKRLIAEAKNAGKLVDATAGRKTRAAVLTSSDHIILSAIQPETIASRMKE